MDFLKLPYYAVKATKETKSQSEIAQQSVREAEEVVKELEEAIMKPPIKTLQTHILPPNPRPRTKPFIDIELLIRRKKFPRGSYVDISEYNLAAIFRQQDDMEAYYRAAETYYKPDLLDFGISLLAGEVWTAPVYPDLTACELVMNDAHFILKIVPFLPFKDIILSAQGINKRWKECINESPEIQFLIWRWPLDVQAFLPWTPWESTDLFKQEEIFPPLQTVRRLHHMYREHVIIEMLGRRDVFYRERENSSYRDVLGCTFATRPAIRSICVKVVCIDTYEILLEERLINHEGVDVFQILRSLQGDPIYSSGCSWEVVRMFLGEDNISRYKATVRNEMRGVPVTMTSKEESLELEVTTKNTRKLVFMVKKLPAKQLKAPVERGLIYYKNYPEVRDDRIIEQEPEDPLEGFDLERFREALMPWIPD